MLNGPSREGHVQYRRPQRSRGGRRFEPRAELALQPALQELASRLPGSNLGVIAIAEMVGPLGVPDLVAVPTTPDLATRMDFNCSPILSLGDAQLVSLCSGKRPMSDSMLSDRLQIDTRSVSRRARRLEREGALILEEDGWIRDPRLAPVGRIYALEAKVCDWSAGLGQALRYGSWADSSAAVMAYLPKDRTRAIAQAKSLGLGLAIGNRWLVRPKLWKLSPAQKLWASEHVIAALRVDPAGHKAPQSPSSRA